MNADFAGKRALVTGAGKGIGREVVLALVQAGAEVAAVSRTEADLVTLREEIGCVTLAADLADTSSAQIAGAIDLLVTNAGISIPQSFLTTELAAWEATFAVNVRAAFLISQAVARRMVARVQCGSIVMLSSQASQVGIADHTAYCASNSTPIQVRWTSVAPAGAMLNRYDRSLTRSWSMLRNQPSSAWLSLGV